MLGNFLSKSESKSCSTLTLSKELPDYIPRTKPRIFNGFCIFLCRNVKSTTCFVRATCFSGVTHLYISTLVVSGEEQFIKAFITQFSSIFLFLPVTQVRSFLVLNHSQFVLFLQALVFPLFKGGFLLLSWNRFPGVQTILFPGALGLVYCFHGNLFASFTYKTQWIVSLVPEFWKHDRLTLLTLHQRCLSQTSKSI